MRVAYYARPAFLFHSLGLVRAMSRLAEMYLFLEISPEERASGSFGENRLVAAPGVSSAAGALRDGYLAGVRGFLSGLAGFDLVVHPSRRAFSASAIRVALNAAACLRALSPDLIHFEDVVPRTAPLLYLTPRLAKLVSIHDARTHRGDPVGRAERFRRIAMRQATRALFYSRYTRDVFFEDARPSPSSVLPLPTMDVYREWSGQADVAQQRQTVLFFGRLSEYKGLDVLYAALPSIAERVPGLRVVVAGEPGLRYQMPPLPTLRSDASLVMQLERIDGPDVRRLFQSATVVVLPYLEATQSGVVPVAYAFGTPVVASAVGGLPEVVRDGVTGTLVPPNDPHALALAISELLLSPALQAHLRAGIQELNTAELGWPAIAPRLAQVYRDTIHDHAVPRALLR